MNQKKIIRRLLILSIVIVSVFGVSRILKYGREDQDQDQKLYVVKTHSLKQNFKVEFYPLPRYVIQSLKSYRSAFNTDLAGLFQRLGVSFEQSGRSVSLQNFKGVEGIEIQGPDGFHKEIIIYLLHPKIIEEEVEDFKNRVSDMEKQVQ